MVVAENIDCFSNSLSFANVLLNRSKFWGGLVFQGLLVSSENINNVQKDLCKEYTVSPDGRTYIFELKDDLLWHDGESLTMEDVVWSMETCLRFQEVNGYIQKGLQSIEGVEEFLTGEKEEIEGILLDENRITINLSKPDNHFLISMAQLPVLPKHCLGDISLTELSKSDFWQMPVGSGPYKVVENRENKEAVLVLNENYSGRIPKIEKIRYKILENPETDYFTFAITSDPNVIEKYKNNPDYEVIKTGNLYYRYLYFNLDGRSGENAGRLQKKSIRQALAIGIDRAGIIQDIYKGTATLIDGGIPDTDSWYWEKEAEKVEYNPELAGQMLKAAGFDFSKPLVLTRYSQDDNSVRLLESIARNWEELGIQVQIEPVDVSETNKLWVDTDWYDVGLKNLSAVDYNDWYYEYSSENQLWSQILKNRTIFDVLIISLQNTKWSYERELLYKEIQSMEMEEVYKIPLAIIPKYVIYNRKDLYIPLKDFPNMDYYFDLDVSDWEMLEN